MFEQFIGWVQDGDIDKVREALRSDPSLAQSRPDGSSAILAAVYHGHSDVVKLLLEAAHDLSVHEAAATGGLARVQELVGGDPAQSNAEAADGFHPLGLACFFGHEACARWLIDHGADVNVQSNNGLKVAPIHAAVANGSAGVVRRLLEAGADPNLRQQGGFAAIHEAAQSGKIEILDALLAAGADPRASTDDGRTPADLSANRPEALQRLSAAGGGLR